MVALANSVGFEGRWRTSLLPLPFQLDPPAWLGPAMNRKLLAWELDRACRAPGVEG